MNRRAFISAPALWLVLSLVAAVSMSYFVVEIWSANQPPHFSDLYAPWWAAHELLLRGRNPYSPEVAHEIQTVIYGAPTAPSTDDPNGIGGGFAYPAYALLLLWPVVHVSFSAAQKVFFAVAGLFTLLSLALWARAARLRLSSLQWITLALFLLGCFPALEAFKLQNLSLIAAAFIAIAFSKVFSNRLILAGIFLAVSTFKPQFTVALIPWFALWSAADWRRRRSLVWSFLASMLSLMLVSEWLVPRWIPAFLGVVRAYRHYTYAHSLLDVWFTPTFGAIAAAALLVAAILRCWPYRSDPADSQRLVLVTSLLLAATVVVIPTLAPHAQLLLLPGFLCILQAGEAVSSNRVARYSAWAASILLAWPWVATAGLLIAAFWLQPAALHRYWQVPLHTSPLLPLAVLLAVGGLLGALPASGRAVMSGSANSNSL